MNLEESRFPGDDERDGESDGERRAVQDALQRYLDCRRQLVEDGIAAFLASHYKDTLLEVVGYISRGGKRLRGIMALLVCEALGGTPDDALPAAVAVELAHAASLAHDDVLDADVERRGRPAVHVCYDVVVAILVPHLIVPHSVLAAQSYGPSATSAILEGWARTVEGQVQDYPLLFPADGAASLEEYLAIVRNKTAALFETAAVLGAIAASAIRHAALARRYGFFLGRAFQIADDVVDLQQCAFQPWSTVLGDGAHRAARSMHILRRIVSCPHEELVTPASVAQAKRLVSLDVDRCVIQSALFPHSVVRALLSTFPEFAVSQIYNESAPRLH